MFGTGWTDPTYLFVVQTFVLVAVYQVYMVDLDGALDFLLSPGALVCYFVTWFSNWWTKGDAELQPWEERSATWYILNGTVFHLFMDGLAGGFGLGGPLGQMYKLLDKRVADKNVDTLVVLYVEIFIFFPLCILTARAIRQGLPSRRGLEIVTCTCHLLGLVFFVGPELLGGCLNVPTFEPAGGKAGPCGAGLLWPPTVNQLLFFWFGFVFANIPWIIVPSRLLSIALSAVAGTEAEAAPRPSSVGRK
eukprot:Hpha_TRINITY_DN10413_c0_g1::TRINITY_DN10413_c0_g1_i1::g.193457::m.193457/K01824/EBP; cholestenol Delta-isomerase